MWKVVGIICVAVNFLLTASATPLVDFQVSQPPILPHGAKECTVQLIERDFANSYGSPEIVQYIPPTDCGEVGSWAAVSLNLTVTSNGTQYDRLATFTLDQVEIWRTSTPEPTKGDGIIWTYIKDVTRYTPLFSTNGTLILQLDNTIQDNLTGVYSVTVVATFYAADQQYPKSRHADVIIPIGTLADDTGAQATVPPVVTVPVTIPQNSVEIYAEIYASGNSEEEFWYFNTADDYFGDLPNGTTYPYGPFREVRLLVDDRLAGVVFPYASIFTGGYIPAAWRPITSYGALDLPTYYVDLTPFVPLLADGLSHNVSLDVSSAERNHSINANWYVSANLQVVVGDSSMQTTGNITIYDAQPFAVTTVSGEFAEGDLNVTVTATRQVHIEADVTDGNGNTTHVVWTQDLSFSNKQSYSNNTLVQKAIQTSSGSSLSTHGGSKKSIDLFSYPLEVDFTSLNVNFTAWTTYIDHAYTRTFAPSPFVLGSVIHNSQQANGTLVLAATGNTGNGTNDNSFSYADDAGNTYWRKVGAASSNITYDSQGGTLSSQSEGQEPFVPTDSQVPFEARIPGFKFSQQQQPVLH